MRIEPKETILHDGRACVLRSPQPQDAAEMLDFLKKVSGETYFMIRCPDEVSMTMEEEEQFLERQISSRDSFMLAAYVEGRLAGNVGVNAMGPGRKMSHRATLGIAVRQPYWGLGIGSLLMKASIFQARALGCEQLELGVFSDNHRARRLYRNLGFEEWGTTKRAFRLEDGTYRDEIVMGKLL